MNFVLVELLFFILPLLLFAAWEVYSVSRKLDKRSSKGEKEGGPR